MGNLGCLGNDFSSYDVFCAHRDMVPFVPPSSDNVTYMFDLVQKQDIRFVPDISKSVMQDGFQMDPMRDPSNPPMWHTIKEYSAPVSTLKVCASGRIRVQTLPSDELGCPEIGVQPTSKCAFAICTRGRKTDESVQTKNFTHTAQIVKPGIVFSLFLSMSHASLYLSPRIMLILDGGDEVTLVQDSLGPFPIEEDFFADFAVVDDSRNVQVDFIFRTPPRNAKRTDHRRMPTSRSCLQEYTAFNSHLTQANISIGWVTVSSVFLQNLVVNEEQYQEQVPDPQPYSAWKGRPQNASCKGAGFVLFEGEDAHASLVAVNNPRITGSSSMHPQFSKRAPRAQAEISDYWYHIRYNAEPDLTLQETRLRGTQCIEGEFWLSQPVGTTSTHLFCSSSLAQALTMCVAFRFSCTQDYLSLIVNNATTVLRHTHIPTNCVVLGIEPDPRHGGLIRMFIEHRSKIIEDMVLCERHMEDVSRTIVHQEVYDGGDYMIYRVTLLHRDGSRQAAVLQASSVHFDTASNLLDQGRSGQCPLVQDPSPRFPLSPCNVRHDLAPESRIFVYSSMEYKRPIVMEERADTENLEQFQSATEYHPEIFPLDQHRDRDASVDWESVVGGYSDIDADESELGRVVEWQRPLIDSVVLLNQLRDAPFGVFPKNYS